MQGMRHRPILLIAMVTLSGCADPWQTDANVDTPWVAAGKQATQFSRNNNAIWQPKPIFEVEWEDSKGRKHRVRDAFQSSDAFLLKTGDIPSWPASNAWTNDINLRVAPFRIFIVSITPTVVVMIPHDYGDLDGRSISDIVGKRPQHESYSDRLINIVYYGTRVPYSNGTKWFSPDLNTPISDLQINEQGVGVVQLRNGDLQFRKHGDQWHISR